MNEITNLDLDKPDFIDIQTFNQNKAILTNSLDELQTLIKYFNAGQYDKFPKPV